MDGGRIMIDADSCVGCGQCVKVCEAHNLTLENKKVKTILRDCLMCGQCAAVCPQKAVKINELEEPREKSVDTRLNPDDVVEVIRFRRTVRSFKDQKIPQKTVEKILEAGRLTHTAKNMQDVSFTVLDREKDRVEKAAVNLFRKIKPVAGLFSPMARNHKIDGRFFFKGAPLAIVIWAKDKTNGVLAAQNMEFVAEAHGLGVLYSGYFTLAANLLPGIRRALKAPKGKKAAMTLVLGYPGVRFLRSAPRKALDAQYM